MIEQKLKTFNTDKTAFFPIKENIALRIVFMGTPEFAVASLDKLIEAGCNIVGVITAPDKPGGRGMELQTSAVKKYSVEQGLHILQPEKLKNPDFLEELKSLNADIQIVVAFRMLPEVVWNMPPMGTINLHGSLLPQYRGAAPINWAIINGEKETGVTTFKLQHEIDTGNILLRQKIAIADDETAGEIHDRMKIIGADLLLKTIVELGKGNVEEQVQSAMVNGQWPMVNAESSIKELGELKELSIPDNQVALKHAPKIFTETCKINWTKSMDEVYNLIRGLSPYPTAFTFLEEKKLKVYKVDKVDKVPTILPGEFETDKKTFLRFACADGYISIKDLQLEGKKKMLIEDFLRGWRWV